MTSNPLLFDVEFLKFWNKKKYLSIVFMHTYFSILFYLSISLSHLRMCIYTCIYRYIYVCIHLPPPHPPPSTYLSATNCKYFTFIVSKCSHVTSCFSCFISDFPSDNFGGKKFAFHYDSNCTVVFNSIIDNT